MQVTALGINLGIDLDPELYRRLQRRRPGKQVRVLSSDRSRQQQGQ